MGETETRLYTMEGQRRKRERKKQSSDDQIWKNDMKRVTWANERPPTSMPDWGAVGMGGGLMRLIVMPYQKDSTLSDADSIMVARKKKEKVSFCCELK